MFCTLGGNWGQWSIFGTCNAACKRARMRLCDNPPPSTNGGEKCSGGNGTVQVDSAQCNPNYCSKLFLPLWRYTYHKLLLCRISLFIIFLINAMLKNSVCKRHISERTYLELQENIFMCESQKEKYVLEEVQSSNVQSLQQSHLHMVEKPSS